MGFLDRIDPTIRDGASAFPAELITAIGDDPPTAREMFGEIMQQLAEQLPPTDVLISERTIPGPDGGFWAYVVGPLIGGPLGGLVWRLAAGRDEE